jgi:hypothetical protein
MCNNLIQVQFTLHLPGEETLTEFIVVDGCKNFRVLALTLLMGQIIEKSKDEENVHLLNIQSITIGTVTNLKQIEKE